MADIMTQEQRSRCMAAIRSRDTKPDMEVRRFLLLKGLRYRVNNHKLPGLPGVVKKNTKLLFLLMDVFGMVMMDINIIGCLKQM